MSDIVCPVCGKDLIKAERSYRCENSHSFDCAKEGYVNLLAGNHKAGEKTGDNKNMALSRKAFLEKGYFSALSDEIIRLIRRHGKEMPTVCDICCGEGWYSDRVLKEIPCNMLCFDLSKEMVRLAAKRKNGGCCFVANLSRIPLKDSSTDVAFHLFAPFHEREFKRIIKNDGIIITTVAGENHLFEIKEILYDTPYKNDEMPPETDSLKLTEKIKVTDKIHLSSKEDIDALFRMTPYYYRTSEKDKQKLLSYEELEVTVDFAIFVYKKS
ncbi:MAG: methyltransferase domain-containing protein [Clostridia bacterium]|nr:methyltransferase domain-containing protein [Clostridia bacterium]